MIWIILAVYLVIFVWWYRNRYLNYLNRRDQHIAHNKMPQHNYDKVEVSSINECKGGAMIMALFWPLTILPWLLSLKVSTDKQREELQKKREKKLKQDRWELREQARKLNLPGWESL